MYVGLIPVNILYNYYFTENVVQQETMDILNKYLEETGKNNFRVPFMCLKNDLFQSNMITDKDEIDTVVSVKRYLEID